MGGTRIARRLRRITVASVVAVIGLALAAPLASADPCPPLELGCVLDDTTTTVGGVIEDTTTTVGGVVDGAAGSVDTGTIPLRPVPGGSGNGDALPDIGDTPSGGSATPPNGGGSTPGESTNTGPSSPGSQAKPTVDLAGGTQVGVAPAPTGVASTTVGDPFPAFLDDAPGGSLLSGGRLVRTVAFPLALVLLVIGFAVVQDRIDRKDPKLALAPLGSDHLTFS